MRIERMAEQQVETKHSPRKFENRKACEGNREVFVVSGIEEQSEAMARWSLSPTPILSFGETMPEVAESLSQIEIVDPNIVKRIKRISKKDRKISEDDIAFTASVASAKAKVMQNQEGLTLKEKKGLKQFQETILKGVGKTIAGVGGGRALRTTTALSLTLTACSTAVTPKTPEITQGVEPVATEVTSTPTETEESTPIPTETPTSTLTSEPSPTVEPTSTPEIKVSDITDEVRLFVPTTVIGERRLLPFGISEHPRVKVREGYKGQILSAILLEAPYYDGEAFVVFKLGIPDFSQGKFREFYLRDPIDANLEAELICPMRPSVRNIVDGGFDLLGGTSRYYPPEEAMELYEKAIGRQIAFVLEVGTTEAHELEHLESILERYDPWAVPSAHAYKLLISQVHENYKVFTYLLSGNPAYEGKEFGMVISSSYVPWSSADWK